MSNSLFDRANTHRRVDALFRAMATDFLLREQFVTNPAQVVAHYVSGARMNPAEESAINHLVYSIAASPQLLTWLRRYAVASNGKHISLDRFLADFSAAVTTQRGHFVVASLMNAALHGQARLPQQHLETAKNSLIHLFGRAPDRPGGLVPGRGGFTAIGLPGGDTDDTFNTFKTEGTWTGTGTDTTWVTVDTGTIFTAGGTVTGTLTVTDLETWHTGTDTTGTDSTGTDSTGTEITGTESTGTDFTGTGSTGTEATGTETTGTDSTGTDMTGTEETGTEATGTEGTESGIVFSPDNYAAITLVALSEYAQILARTGALAIGAAGGMR